MRPTLPTNTQNKDGKKKKRDRYCASVFVLVTLYVETRRITNADDGCSDSCEKVRVPLSCKNITKLQQKIFTYRANLTNLPISCKKD